MTLITSLPENLLSAIFDTIDSNDQLAECRLVCKKWNGPAATSMLGNTIAITSDKAASKVFEHLFQDPSRIASIKHLHFELKDEDLRTHIYKLLLLAVHPDVERLTGSVKSRKFFETLLSVINSSSREFTKLQTVPLYTGPDLDLNMTIALNFKRSLTFPNLALDGQTTLAARDFLGNLDQFENLDTVMLGGHLDGLEWMEDLLRSNSKLEGFGVIDFVFNDLFADKTRCEGLNCWLASHVQRESALNYIVYSSPMLCPEVVQYWCYKYPNLRYLEVKGGFWLSDDRLATEPDFFHAVDLILNVVKKIEYKVIQLVLPREVSLMAAMKYLSSREENIGSSIEEYLGQHEAVLNLIDTADGLWPDGFTEIFD